MAKRGPKGPIATSYGQKGENKRNTTKPGSGRPPNTFKMRMATLAARAKTVKQVESILDDKDHPAFMKALEFAADRGFGKEALPVDATLTVTFRDE